MRPPPHRYGALSAFTAGYALALATALTALTGCANAPGGADARPATTAATRPAPRTTAPQDLCARLVTHWAGVILDGGSQANLDYQAMGLSGGQNDILRAVADAARAEESAHGRAAADRLISARAKDRCAERYRDGGPTGGPWQ
ncbi:hypothetical protein [Streptomyces liangshanensis]|uniref:Lipoprotein n=1 Tax=Streptomyces liangshanensis TaxID=2717324 RepID=A0A6G9H426_9ACTN|nr:hypothetical protein [Streptomyces liangshanensis]QIQ05288.1 hypothetical protein HA039_26080 [Streptomyces liangshanensis]